MFLFLSLWGLLCWLYRCLIFVPLGADSDLCEKVDLTLSWTGAVSRCLFESYDLNNVSQSYFRGKRKKSDASSISEIGVKSFHNASSSRLQVLGQITELRAFSSHNLGPVGNVNRKYIVAMESAS